MDYGRLKPNSTSPQILLNGSGVQRRKRLAAYRYDQPSTSSQSNVEGKQVTVKQYVRDASCFFAFPGTLPSVAAMDNAMDMAQHRLRALALPLIIGAQCAAVLNRKRAVAQEDGCGSVLVCWGASEWVG
jgi:hypothetical protein